MTRVVNLREARYEVYVGRTNDRFHFGNPASHLPESLALVRVKTRADAVQYYADWLDGKHPDVEPERRHWVLHQIPALTNKVLGCYCKPYPCHGDILADRANSYARKEQVMQLLGFDTETHRIGPGRIAPPLVCASMSLGSADAGEQLVCTGNREEMDAAIEAVLREPAVTIVGQNLAFDMAVLANHRPDWMPLIWQAYTDGRIKDVMLREKFLVLASTGDLEFYTVPSGDKVKLRFSLAALVQKYFGIDLSAVKDEDDAWRTNYDALDNVPLSRWPADAVNYAIEDARWPLAIYHRQEQTREELKAKIGLDPLQTEDFRAGVAFALQLLTCWGHRVDAEEKRKLEDELAAELSADKLDLLVREKILRPAEPPKPYKNGAKDHLPTCADPKTCSCPPKMTTAIKESIDKRRLTGYVERFAKQSEGKVVLRYTDRTSQFPEGQVSITSEWLDDYHHMDPVLGQYKHRQDLQKLITTELPRMCYRDHRGEPLVGPDGRTITAEIVHPCYDALKSTGRTSSFSVDMYPSINDQNVDPRARRCYIPRDGMLLWSVDFSAMELVSAAQVCLSLFGHSVLAEKIKAGIDPHAYLGAQIAYETDADFRSLIPPGTDQDGIYKVFAGLKKVEDPDIKKFFKHYRTLAKPTGLGYPGGLGPDTFVKFAKPYAQVDRDMAVRLRETWLATYPEFREYFEYLKRDCLDPFNTRIRKYTKDDGTVEEKEEQAFRYVSPLGMYRAGCDYCACANGQALQTPSAEGALLALFNVQRACYDPALRSILYGGRVRPTGFIHDEIVGEVVDDLLEAETLLNEVARIMVESFARIIPDVPIKAQPVLMRRWDKAAEAVFNADGHLAVWEPRK